MTDNLNSAIGQPLITYLLHLANISFNSLKYTETDLTISGVTRDCIHTAQNCNLQIRRLCNSYAFLLLSGGRPETDGPVNFDADNLIEKLLSTFSKSLSGYCITDIKYSSNLSPHTSLRVDQKLFELTIINILYSFIKSRISQKPSVHKFTVYVTETRDEITVHIRGNNSRNNPGKMAGAMADRNSIIDMFSNCDSESLAEISLQIAQKAISFACGRIELAQLKTGIRYDITFPKSGDTPVKTMSSIAPYRPSRDVFNEAFSEFQLETMLEKLVDLLSPMEDLKL